jgi:hypothetical protein
VKRKEKKKINPTGSNRAWITQSLNPLDWAVKKTLEIFTSLKRTDISFANSKTWFRLMKRMITLLGGRPMLRMA